MVTYDTSLDDDSWSTEDIAKLYCSAAKLANYSNSDIAHFTNVASRQRMLAELNGLRTYGWIRCIEPFDVRNTVKIPFYSLAELELKLTISGML